MLDSGVMLNLLLITDVCFLKDSINKGVAFHIGFQEC